jgi:hypothetical protein
MDRRTFIGRLAGGALAAPLVARAQLTGKPAGEAVDVLFANLNWSNTNAAWGVAEAQRIADNTRRWYLDASYGKSVLRVSVSSFVKLSVADSAVKGTEWTVEADHRLLAAGFDQTKFDRVVYITPRTYGPGGFKGLCWGRQAWVNCGGADYASHSAIHELGHSFGLQHSGKVFVGTRAGKLLTLPPLSQTTGGRFVEFYDTWTAMGYEATQAHFNAPEKARLGWIVPTLYDGTDRTYTLKPMEEQGTGIRAVKVPGAMYKADSKRVYWLENRYKPGLPTSGVQLRICGDFNCVPQAWFDGVALAPGETIADGSVTIDVLDGGSIRIRPFVAAPPPRHATVRFTA